MNEAVRPLNKQELDWNSTKENIIYVRAWALNWFNTGVKEQRTGSHVGFRPLIEAEVDGQASNGTEQQGSSERLEVRKLLDTSWGKKLSPLYRWKPN